MTGSATRWAAILFLAAGCHHAASPPTEADQFALALDDAQCVRAARCGVIGASEVAACQARNRQFPPSYSASRAADAGRLTFDAALATTCLDAVEQAACSVDGQLSATASCLLFTARVTAGHGCQQDGECIGGYCQRDVPLDGCSGKCVTYLAIGAACQPTADLCESDAYCDSTAMVCVARPTTGEACADAIPCSGSDFCVAPISPAPSPSPAPPPPSPGPVCSGPGAQGTPCIVGALGNTSCASGLYCRTSETPNLCTTVVADGQPCDSLDACPDSDDCVGLAMDATTGDITSGVCHPFVDVGGACDPALTENGCPYDMVCDATTSKCRAYAPLDSDCTANGSRGFCDTGLYCNGTTGACTTEVPFGGACQTPPIDSTGTPTGQDPCHDGSCSGGRCRLVCE